MNGKIFWELSEVYTAPLNLFFILLGIMYSLQQGLTINISGILIFIVSLVLLHIATNIFNNYMDYKNATAGHGYKEKTNIIGRENLSLKMVWHYFLFFISMSILVGAYLVYQEGWPMLIFGFIGFSIALFYSAGPKPLNSLPIAETVTSLAMGFLIPLVTVYLNHPPKEFAVYIYVWLFLLCIPFVLVGFSSLLANNTCDLEEDIQNNRKTLVYYIGKKRAVLFLKNIYPFIYLWLIFLIAIGKVPLLVLLIVFTYPKGRRKLQAYFDHQDKKTTFPIVISVFSKIVVFYPILFCLGYILTMFI